VGIFDIIPPVIGVRILFVLGIVNLVTGLLIFFSCRCIPGARIMGKLMKYSAYRRYFRYHCYIWRVFWPSVIVHAIIAIVYVGIPF